MSCLRASSLAESSWLSFSPSLPTPTGWTLDVLGNPVDPLSVVYNGSRHFHACASSSPLHTPAASTNLAHASMHSVHRGVCYQSPSSSAIRRGLVIESIDAPLVAPGDTDHIVDFDNELPQMEGGMHFNLHNNVGWDCSAPWWYAKDESFRFRLGLGREQCWP